MFLSKISAETEQIIIYVKPVALPELTLLKTAFNDFDIPAISEITGMLQTYTNIPEIGIDIKKILYCKISGEYDDAVLAIDKVINTISL